MLLSLHAGALALHGAIVVAHDLGLGVEGGYGDVEEGEVTHDELRPRGCQLGAVVAPALLGAIPAIAESDGGGGGGGEAT